MCTEDVVFGGGFPGPRRSRPFHERRKVCGPSIAGGLRIALTAAVISLGGLFASAALAADPSMVTKEVRVSRIDPNPPSQSAAMHTLARLKNAALEACGGSPFSLAELRIAIRASECWHESLANAVARVGSPQLNQAFKGHGD